MKTTDISFNRDFVQHVLFRCLIIAYLDGLAIEESRYTVV